MVRWMRCQLSVLWVGGEEQGKDRKSPCTPKDRKGIRTYHLNLYLNLYLYLFVSVRMRPYTTVCDGIRPYNCKELMIGKIRKCEYLSVESS